MVPAVLVPELAVASVMRANGNVSQTENILENLYISGASPVIAGTVQGDLVATGGNVYVNGTIFQDATIAAGTVNVTGHVGGDLRVFGGTLLLDGQVDGELLAFGGSVMIGPHAVIRGDFNAMAGKVEVDPAAKLLGSKKNIQTDHTVASVHCESFEPCGTPEPYFDTNKFLSAAFWFTQIVIVGGMLIVVLILHWLFPNFTKKFVQEAAIPKMFWGNFLRGLMLFLLMPMAAILAFLTGIGAFLGVLILIAYFAFIISSMLYGGVVFGGLLYELIKKPKKYNMGVWWLVFGVAMLHVVTWLPVVGWMIGFVFFLVAWGAMAALRWKQMKGG